LQKHTAHPQNTRQEMGGAYANFRFGMRDVMPDVTDSVATHSRCGESFNDSIIPKLSPDTDSETISKIG